MFHYFDKDEAHYFENGYELIKTSKAIEINSPGLNTTSFIIAIEALDYDQQILRPNRVLTTTENHVLSGGKKIIIVAPTSTKRPEQTIKIPSSGAYEYIDGCTDSLLVPPTFKGEDCLNALYFPPDT